MSENCSHNCSTCGQSCSSRTEPQNLIIEPHPGSHIKHIISVFIRNTSKQANLSVKKQKQLMREILEDETTVSALNEFSPESTVFRIISFIFRKKMINTCYLIIAIASKIKE